MSLVRNLKEADVQPDIIVDPRSAAKISQLVVDDDGEALSKFLLALAEENRKPKRLKYCLGSVLDAPDDNGWRPLHHAFNLRRYDCAKLLIDAGDGDLFLEDGIFRSSTSVTQGMHFSI
jgi:ankyrin repeat protein